MVGLAILLVFNLLGWLLHRFGYVPLPENVLGMLLLLVALQSGAVKLAWVEGAADFLLCHMMLFFAPIIVGVIPLLPVLESNWLPISAGMLVSPLVTMLATAWVAQALTRPQAEVTHGS